MITDYDRINFNRDHILMRNERDNGWVAVNKHTKKEVSPTYSDPQGAIYFVIKLLQEEIDKTVENILRGDHVGASLYDADPLYCGLSTSVQRNGQKEE